MNVNNAKIQADDARHLNQLLNVFSTNMHQKSIDAMQSNVRDERIYFSDSSNINVLTIVATFSKVLNGEHFKWLDIAQVDFGL